MVRQHDLRAGDSTGWILGGYGDDRIDGEWGADVIDGYDGEGWIDGSSGGDELATDQAVVVQRAGRR